MFGHKVRGAAGFIEVMDPDRPKLELETRQCCHCGMHWIYKPGSGTVRGFCMKCNGTTCGAERCNACVPQEAQIEIIEGTKPGQAARKYLDEFFRIQEPKR